MKERKPYTTKNRSEILNYLKKNCSSTISAADIKKHLEEKEISVNTTTVYRLLDKLCAENIIIKYYYIHFLFTKLLPRCFIRFTLLSIYSKITFFLSLLF